jgi:hypothetical protein
MRYLFFLLVVFYTATSLSAQSVKSILESRIETMMRDDSRTWKASNYILNSANITDSSERTDYLIISGQFKAQITQWPFRGVRNIDFQAKVVMLLGEPTVKKIWWIQPILESTYCIGDCG